MHSSSRTHVAFSRATRIRIIMSVQLLYVTAMNLPRSHITRHVAMCYILLSSVCWLWWRLMRIVVYIERTEYIAAVNEFYFILQFIIWVLVSNVARYVKISVQLLLKFCWSNCKYSILYCVQCFVTAYFITITGNKNHDSYHSNTKVTIKFNETLCHISSI